jgi:hypothetical protein
MVPHFSVCHAQKIYCTQFNDRSLRTANIAMRVKSFKMISFKENFVSGKLKSKKYLGRIIWQSFQPTNYLGKFCARYKSQFF